MGRRYFAIQPLKLGERTIQPGEEIPEAATFRFSTLRALVNNQRIEIREEESSTPLGGTPSTPSADSSSSSSSGARGSKTARST